MGCATWRFQTYGTRLEPEVHEPVAEARQPIAVHRNPLLHQTGDGDPVALKKDGGGLAVVLLDRPVPRATPQVAVVVERVVADLAGRVRREELVPSAAPDVVEGRAGVRAAERDPRVLPEQVLACLQMHEIEDLGASLREDGHSQPIALEPEPRNSIVNVVGVDDGPQRSSVAYPNALQPPSTTSVVPVTKPARSDARKRTAAAISWGSARRPIGVRPT